MHTIPRNAWYKLFHRRNYPPDSTFTNHPSKCRRRILSTMQITRNRPETEQPMFFTCIQKQSLRKAVFKRYLSNPKDVNCSTVFQGLSAIKLSKYYILNYHDKLTTYDFF